MLTANPAMEGMKLLKVCIEDIGGDGEFMKELGV